MPKEFNLEDILKNNPSIRREDLEANELLAKQLREAGIKPHGYQLAQPFDRRRAKAGVNEGTDPRTINLRASRH